MHISFVCRQVVFLFKKIKCVINSVRCGFFRFPLRVGELTGNELPAPTVLIIKHAAVKSILKTNRAFFKCNKSLFLGKAKFKPAGPDGRRQRSFLIRARGPHNY